MPPKFDATDLFNMLSMDDGPSENGSGEASTDNNWAGFQCMSQNFSVIFVYWHHLAFYLYYLVNMLSTKCHPPGN